MKRCILYGLDRQPVAINVPWSFQYLSRVFSSFYDILRMCADKGKVQNQLEKVYQNSVLYEAGKVQTNHSRRSNVSQN